MRFIVVTNNELVREAYEGTSSVLFVDGVDRDVFVTARDRIHQGHRLLTHPLCGSVKPGETPFRSLLISEARGQNVDPSSLELIEASLDRLATFRVRYKGLSERVLNDFRVVDKSLIDSAIPTAMADRTQAVGD